MSDPCNHDSMAIQIDLNKYSIKYDKSDKEDFLCEICLWTFETDNELNIHNYLEHLIIKDISGK